MIRFDTLDKKPKLYHMIPITAAMLVLLSIIQIWKGSAGFGLMNAILAAYFLLVVILLIVAFFRQLRYNPYSYNTIYYSGFAIFLSSAVYTHIRAANMSFNSDVHLALYSTLTYLKEAPYFFIYVSIPFLLFISLLLLISNISLIRHEGKRLVNL